jgi:hypothetical protein
VQQELIESGFLSILFRNVLKSVPRESTDQPKASHPLLELSSMLPMPSGKKSDDPSKHVVAKQLAGEGGAAIDAAGPPRNATR